MSEEDNKINKKEKNYYNVEGSSKQGAQDIIGIPLGVLPKSEQYRHVGSCTFTE